MIFFLILVAVVLLLANALFVAAEFVIVAVRRSRMLELADRDPRARLVLAAMHDVRATLASAQLGVTMASIGLGFTADAAVEAALGPLLSGLPLPGAAVHVAGGTVAVVIVAAAHSILGEMVPRNLALVSPDRAALWLIPVVRPFAQLVYPAARALTWMADQIVLALGVEPQREGAESYDVEEIAAMLELSAREGAIATPDQELMTRAVRFASRTVEDVMVPWDQVTAVPDGASKEEIERAAAQSGHPRLPVVSDGRVRGYVHVLDVAKGDEPQVRPVMEIPRGTRLVPLFEELRHVSQRIGVIIGEGDEPIGLVTLDDLLDDLLLDEIA